MAKVLDISIFNSASDRLVVSKTILFKGKGSRIWLSEMRTVSEMERKTTRTLLGLSDVRREANLIV